MERNEVVEILDVGYEGGAFWGPDSFCFVFSLSWYGF
jgi:hypothetical protein